MPDHDQNAAVAAWERRRALTADIDNRFAYHRPTPDQITNIGWLRDQLRITATAVADATPDSRERSLALTHLEDALFWAIAAIARHTPTGERRTTDDNDEHTTPEDQEA